MSRASAVVLGSFLALPALASAAVDLNVLVERSPFAPAGQAAEAAPEAPSQLEFRGMTTDETGTYFSVFNVSNNRGRWLREGESGESFTVRSFDQAGNTLEVEHQGKPLKLTLKRATIAAGAPMAVAPVPAPQAAGRPAGGRDGGRNNTGAAAQPPDPQRLEAVAAEVRRRRALRNAAAQPAAAGQAAPAPTPAAQ